MIQQLTGRTLSGALPAHAERGGSRPAASRRVPHHDERFSLTIVMLRCERSEPRSTHWLDPGGSTKSHQAL